MLPFIIHDLISGFPASLIGAAGTGMIKVIGQPGVFKSQIFK